MLSQHDEPQEPPPMTEADESAAPIRRREVLDGLAPYRQRAAQQFAAFVAAHPDGIYTAAEAKQRDALYFWLTSFDAAEREAGRDDA
jgi:hypothetical protein